MENSITLKEVLDYMDTPMAFSIAFCTADKRKNTGGEWVEIPKAWKHEFLTTREKVALAKAQPSTTLRKNPNHYQNSTRNLRLPNKGIRKVHIRLITIFNGQVVL